MSTQAQIDANRRNSQWSTGPRTYKGKAVARQNAFKHGLRSEAFIAIEDDPSEYYQLCARLVAEHKPQTETEEHYVERMAIAYHKLCFLEYKEEENSFGDKYDDAELRTIWQYQTRLERSYDKALAELRKLQAERRKREADAPAAKQPETAAVVTEAPQSTIGQPPPENSQAQPLAAPPLLMLDTDPGPSPAS